MGKTELSIRIAQEFNCEIISVDSMQVYKYMDIGTAKVKKEEQKGVAHYLIDIVDPDKNYEAGRFVQDALIAIDKIIKSGKTPLLTGGTGLYYKALIEGISNEIPPFPQIRADLIARYKGDPDNSNLFRRVQQVDPESAKRLHQNDTQRLLRALEIFEGTGVPWSETIEKHKMSKAERFTHIAGICLTRPRERLYERINKRCTLMLEQGFQNEVEDLLKRGYSLKDKSMNSIGYKHMCLYLNKSISFEEMIETMSRDTRRYAKRQLTWFKKMKGIKWIDANNHDETIEFLHNTVS